MGRASAGVALMAMALMAIAPAAQAAKPQKFKVVALAGTQVSETTTHSGGYDPEEETTTPECTRVSSERVSFTASETAIAYVSSRRSHGHLRTVWSSKKRPGSAFDVVALDGRATVSRSVARSGECGGSDCSAEAAVPWTSELAGARLDAGGAWIGADPDFGTALDACPYTGIRGLREFSLDIDTDDPAPHLFTGRDLFGAKKKLTGTESFQATGANGSSTVELTATLKRLKSKRR